MSVASMAEQEMKWFQEAKDSGDLDKQRKDNAAYQLADDVVLAIPRDSFLRKDSHQVVFYGRMFLDMWARKMTPSIGILLALLDGQRSLGDISAMLQAEVGGSKELNDYKVRSALARVDIMSSEHRKVINRKLEPNAQIRVYNPRDFFIPADQVRLSDYLEKPIGMLWMPTSVCQTDCAYCYATRRPIAREDMLSDQRVRELFDEAAEIGIRKINVDGGDVFCRPGVIDLLAYAESLELQCDISTKAYVSKDMAKALYDTGIRLIQVGFDAPYPDLFDKVVGSKGAFHRTIETIRNCTDAGVACRTNSIIIQETAPHIEELVELLYTLPLRDMKIATAFRSLHRHRDGLLLSEAMKEQLRKKIGELQQKHPDGKIKFECRSDYMAMNPQDKQNAFENFPRCGIGQEVIIIAPDGKVVMCEQSPHGDEYVVGNLKDQSIMDVWSGEEMTRFKFIDRSQFEGTVCYDCEDFKTCFHGKGGCFIMTVKAYGTRYGPHPACPKAPLYASPID